MKKKQKGFTVVEGLLIAVIVSLVVLVGWYVMYASGKSKQSLDNANKITNITTTQPAKKQSSQNQDSKTASPTPIPSPTNNKSTTTPKTSIPAPPPTTPTPPLSQPGFIKGKVSFPSEGIPADERICAETTSRSLVGCVNVGGQTSFTLGIPVGTYYVYAEVPTTLPGTRAYWNQYVVCGLQYECPAAGHKQLIAVTVGSGQTVTGVDPGDWYDY